MQYDDEHVVFKVNTIEHSLQSLDIKMHSTISNISKNKKQKKKKLNLLTKLFTSTIYEKALKRKYEIGFKERLLIIKKSKENAYKQVVRLFCFA